MNRLNYRGYFIEARPDQLQAGGWHINVLIERHTGADVRVRSISAGNIFIYEDEAIAHCL